MRIGIVIPTTPSYSETFFNSKIRALKSQGYQIYLFVNKPGTSSFHNITIVHQQELKQNLLSRFLTVLLTVGTAILVYPKILVKFTKLERLDGTHWAELIRKVIINHHIFKKGSLDYLHYGYLTMAIDREKVAQALNAKMTASIRGYDISLYPLNKPGVYSKVWKNLDRLHVISDALLAEAYNLGMPKTISTHKVTPAIDYEKFSEARVEPKPDANVHFLTVARLKWVKGLHYVLDALAILKSKGVTFSYTIVGDGEEFERIKYQINQLKLTDSVLLTGKLSPEEVREKMRSIEFYLQYSIQEGFCNAVLEAQAMGMISLVSDAQGLSENIVDGKTGFVVKKRDPVALADKILEVIGLPTAQKTAIQQNARSRISSDFDIEKQKKLFVEFFC